MDLKRALDVEEEVVDGDEEELAGCPDAKRRRTFVKCVSFPCCCCVCRVGGF